MPRFDALSGTVTEAATLPKPRPRKAAPKAPASSAAPIVEAARVPEKGLSETPISRHACRIPAATFAALLGLPDVSAAREAQARFVAWCRSRPDLGDWRAGWRLFSTPAAPIAAAVAVPIAAPAVLTAARCRAQSILDAL